MSDEERTKRKVSFDQIPIRQRTSLEAQLPKVSKAKGCGCLLIFIVLLIFVFNAIFGGDEDKPSRSETPKPVQTQQPVQDNPKPVEQDKKPVPDLGEHWIKNANDVYLWNPKPQVGESVTWSGGFIQDGDYRYAEGAGVTTWYLNGEIEQIDEGTFQHGQRHGHFIHKFPSGRIIYSDWDNGIEITKPAPDSDDVTAARQTFLNYHKAITNKNYREAYDILSYNQRQRVGNFDSYVAGFKNTISSEVSDINLVSSDDDSITFNYTLTAYDRYYDGRVKMQIFNGQVVMAKDKGRWYIRSAKSNKVDERIE